MIVVFGSIIVDHLFAVPVLPRRGETVLGERYSVMPGGKGANQALAAARDGGSVELVGAVGNDHLALLALEGARNAGVKLAGIRSPRRSWWSPGVRTRSTRPGGRAGIGLPARQEGP